MLRAHCFAHNYGPHAILATASESTEYDLSIDRWRPPQACL